MLKDCFDSWYLNHTKFKFLGPASTADLAPLEMCPTLDSFRKPDEQLEYLRDCANSGKVYLAVIKNLIVGYVVLNKATDETPLSLPKVLELTALEVSKYYRNYSIATCLMQAIKHDAVLEKYIVATYEASLKKCNNPEVTKNRRVILKLLYSGNFTHLPLNDTPESSNTSPLFMVKIGSKVPPDILCYFKAIRSAIK